MMKLFFLLNITAVMVAAVDPSNLSILLPTAKPTSQDIWDCALSAYTPYFNPPKPTGTLFSAIDAYGDELLGGCTERVCPYPDATKWCGFTTAAPTAVLPAYTSYASSASAWWANHSSSALELAKECPDYWYEAMTDEPSAAMWLNLTISNAECFAKAAPRPSSSRAGSAGSSSLLAAPSSAGVSSPGQTSGASAKPSSIVSSSSRAVATPSPGSKVSPDGTCAGTGGYSCPGSGFGDCCSNYGWCGSDTHCGSGCQVGFGRCNASSKTSPDGTCGTVNNNNGWICPGSGFGDCCSVNGWCGNDTGYCGGGCQSAYGTCNAAANALTARREPVYQAQSAVTRGSLVEIALAATMAVSEG